MPKFNVLLEQYTQTILHEIILKFILLSVIKSFQDSSRDEKKWFPI